MFLFLDMPTLKFRIIIIIKLPTERPEKNLPTARKTKIKLPLPYTRLYYH